MIGSLTGILKESNITDILIDVQGVGYIVFIPMSTYDKLPRLGEKVSILTYTHVREDDIQLFGFATPEEKSLFKLLLTVSGIGPKIALSTLSTMSIPSFCAAVANGDVKVINRVNGIGKKTAELIVLQLKDKIKNIAPGTAFPSKVSDAGIKAAEDAISALIQLGFKYDSASKTVHELLKTTDPKECSTENLIRLSLSSLKQ